jgi:uncharacterized protein (UPF0548 family)
MSCVPAPTSSLKRSTVRLAGYRQQPPMPRRLSPLRRVTTATRWPVGVGLTSWRYLWRTTPMHRVEEPGGLPEDAEPELPDGVDRDQQQPAQDGIGPLFHRRYRVRIGQTERSPEDLMARLRRDLNAVAPTELAVFHKLRGTDGEMRAGDEYLVRMPGPWDGPVRTVQVTPRSFRFLTLEGHLEAGQIEFRAARDGELVFEIESWARSGSRLSNLLYHHLHMSKEVQLHMWTSLLERVVKLVDGRRRGAIEIQTRRVEGGSGRRMLRDEGARRALDQLHDKPLNFDLDRSGQLTPGAGWHVDDYREPLPSEGPGEPAPGGSWQTARRLMRDYEFADPGIVRAIYHPDRPLEQRDMLLEVRFLGLRFHLGVRVGGVVDEARTVDGRAVRVWGWDYRTLQGHLEMGAMDYEVWKWLDSGEVEFRIHVVSRAAEIENPLLRLGFRLVGRREQRRFARHACERMARLTAAELAHGAGAAPVPLVRERIAVQPASEAAGRLRRGGRVGRSDALEQRDRQ